MVEIKRMMIAPAGPNLESISKVIKQMPFSALTIISPEKYNDIAEKTKSSLEKENIQVKILTLKEDYWENFFSMIKSISSLHDNEENDSETEIAIYTTVGDSELRTIATTSAFSNGLKAIAYDNNKLRILPLFKFNYYSSITDKKLEILKILEEDITCCKSLDELSRRTKMSLPLISYHVNGNLKSEGLKKMGLVETRDERGKIVISLSTQGRMLLKGLLDEDQKK